MSTLVFVYGTLRTGELRAHVVSRCINRGIFRTEPKYTLLDFGPFPGLVEGGNTAVVGEVLEVDNDILQELDWIEGHPNFYRRQAISLEGIDGAVAYIAVDSTAVDKVTKIASGDWVNRNVAVSSVN